MICPYCSAEVEEGMGFCSNCGQMVRPEAVVAVPPAPAPAMPPPPEEVIPPWPAAAAGLPPDAAPETAALPAWPGPAPGGFPPSDPPAPTELPPPPPYQPTAAPYGPLPPVVTRPPARRAANPAFWLAGGVLGLTLLVVCCAAGVLLFAFFNPATRLRATPTPVVAFATAPPVAQADPPRIELADFKQLYDDPSRSVLIIDVRSAETYAQGHIKGAISFPEADVDQRVGELPRERLVVAYCQ